MAKRSRNAFTAAVLVMNISAGTAASAGDLDVTLVLHVFNFARVTTADLKAAEDETATIYEEAGVRTVWTDSVRMPHDVAHSRHLTVLLLDTAMSHRMIEAERLARNVVGVAAHDAARAYLLTPRIATVAERVHRNFRVALGRVLAHEIGHLVLPAYSHSRTGIIQPDLDLSNQPLRFSRPQIAAIHATVAADIIVQSQVPFR